MREQPNTKPLPRWTKPCTTHGGILRRMRRIFEIPGSWTREKSARDVHGNECSAMSLDATTACIAGASDRAATLTPTPTPAPAYAAERLSWKLLQEAAGGVDGVVDLNDSWTEEEGRQNALDLINKALAL